jgi:type IV pilus assembly protein PilW
MKTTNLKQPQGPISGFSLVELMIAMTIGLLIIGALMAVIVSAGSSSRSNDRNSELQTNGRYALEALKRDVQVAGYYDFSGGGVAPAPVALPGDCYQFFASNLSQRVWGSNDGVNAFAAKCIPAASYAGSDILVLRYLSLDSGASTDGQLTAGFNTNGGLYLRSAYIRHAMFVPPAMPGAMTATPQADHRVEVHIYYVNPNTSAADGVPSLHRVRLDDTGNMIDEMVVSGIQNLQVQYGVSDAAGNTQYLDANNVNPGVAAATDSVTPAINNALGAPNPWSKVTSLRVWLLARNSTPGEAAFTDTNSYTIGDQTIAAANDHFRRQVLSSTIQLRN